MWEIITEVGARKRESETGRWKHPRKDALPRLPLLAMAGPRAWDFREIERMPPRNVFQRMETRAFLYKLPPHLGLWA